MAVYHLRGTATACDRGEGSNRTHAAPESSRLAMTDTSAPEESSLARTSRSAVGKMLCSSSRWPARATSACLSAIVLHCASAMNQLGVEGDSSPCAGAAAVVEGTSILSLPRVPAPECRLAD